MKPFFVVFDTCTHAKYYRDVHEVLSRPSGAIIRYEYKKRLFSPDAANEMAALVAGHANLPVDAILLYGEEKGYQKGSDDPKSMLTWDTANFVAMRSARIVNVGISEDDDPQEAVLYVFLELRGFPKIQDEKLEILIRALEAQNALPFGDKASQNSWIALLPEQLRSLEPDLATLRTDRWSSIVKRMMTLPTQFSDDIFWRVTAVKEQTRYGLVDAVLRARPQNIRRDPNHWNADYKLHEQSRYVISIQTSSPEGHSGRVPGNATIALSVSDDESGLILSSAQPCAIVPNQSHTIRFRVGNDETLGAKYPTITLETQVPGRTSPYALGSVCDLSVAVSKKPSQLWAYFVSGICIVVFGVLAAVWPTSQLGLKALFGLVAAVSTIAAIFIHTGKLRFGKG